MEQERPAADSNQDLLTRGDYRFVLAWVAGLLLLYAVGVLVGTGLLARYTAETEMIRQLRLQNPSIELNAPVPGPDVSKQGKPVDVLVGISVRRVGEFALRESAWTSDFNIWFRWPKNAVNPGEDFRIVNGQIQQREKVESEERGPQRYEEYHVVARMMKDFDGARFPVADEALLIQVEDIAHPLQALRYVADAPNSYVGPESMPPNVRLIKSLATVKMQSTRSEGKTKVHSQFVFAMLVAPNSASIYLKLFQALFASVAIALVALYIRPIHIDARFGLPVGGFFASVGNIVAIASLLPPANRLALSDMVNMVGLVTIFLVLVQSVISLYLFDSMGRDRLSRLFDRVSFTVLLLGYVAANMALPLAARPG
jgi:hypothetical protein